LLRSQVGRSFQKTVARAFENGFVAFFVESFSLITANLIDGFIELFDDVKTVEDVEGFWKHLGDHFKVRLPHIGADDFDLTAVFGAEVLKETSQRVFLTVFDDSEKSLASRVDLVDQRHIVMAFVISDFVDSKGGNILEFTVFEAVIDHPLYGAIDPVP